MHVYMYAYLMRSIDTSYANISTSTNPSLLTTSCCYYYYNSLLVTAQLLLIVVFISFLLSC
jgi:hypothetical protein